MSISFLPDITPDPVEEECDLCDGTGQHYAATSENPYPCCVCQGLGRAVRRRWPAEANFANGNAYAVMAAFGLPMEPAGSAPFSELPALLQRALCILNDDRAAAQHTRAAWSEEAGWAGVEIRQEGNLVEIVRMGPTVRSFGLDVDGLRERVRAVVAVVQVAHELGVGISWG